MSIVHKIGRRKTSVARVYVKPGAGNITVNGRDAKEYFNTEMLVYKVNQPFLLTETVGPVSYTHLDVYKRQPSNNEAAVTTLTLFFG